MIGIIIDVNDDNCGWPLIICDEGCIQPVVKSCEAVSGCPSAWVCPGMFGKSNGLILLRILRLFTVMVWLCMPGHEKNL